MNSFFTALNEGSSDLISKIDLVNKGFSSDGTDYRQVLAFLIQFHSIHCEVAAQDLEVA